MFWYGTACLLIQSGEHGYIIPVQTFAIFWMLYVFFWVIPQHLNFKCQCFRTPCLFHLHRRVGIKNNWGWECWGIYTGKSLAWNPFYTSLRKRDSHMKHNSSISTNPWLTLLTLTRAVSPSHTHPWPPCGSLPSWASFCTRTCPHPVTLLLIGSGYFRAETFSV